MKDTLARLSQSFGPSGREEEIRTQLTKELAALDKNLAIRTDALGNLIATKPGTKSACSWPPIWMKLHSW